ncbi:hypothetical protein R6L23_04260 [Streptomyces sp. SR27]|uniref:hypothetical protein n=1 Tax=Streptomyces sp. SR27 TaxID=3076630 RepID=UPI00295B3A17|nr:hypothetical protein [Streptomyces sp. SR27]MDV9187440.1 hypothetical protein [Streptomyces sp. SR27]
MTTKHHEFLTQGAVGLLLSIAVASRNPGAAPLEDELQRLSRLLQDSRAIAHVMPLESLASLLDLLADEVGTEVFETRPVVYRERLARAAGDDAPADFLRSMAELIRDRRLLSYPDLTELPLSDWEASARFSLTSAFIASMVSGEYESVDEALDEILTSEHPDCQELADLAGELQRLLYLFRTPAELDAAFATARPHVTHARVGRLLDAVHAHFAEQH